MHHVLIGAISWEDFAGNEFAHAFAKIVAEVSQLEKHEVDRIKQVDEEAWTIQTRIVLTHMEASTLAPNRREQSEGYDEGDPENGMKEVMDKRRLRLSLCKILSEVSHSRPQVPGQQGLGPQGPGPQGPRRPTSAWAARTRATRARSPGMLCTSLSKFKAAVISARGTVWTIPPRAP